MKGSEVRVAVVCLIGVFVFFVAHPIYSGDMFFTFSV